MRQFIGLVLLIGIIHKPVIEMYWSTDPLYVTPLFSSVMQRNRFSMLLKFFHLNDNTQEPKKEDPNRDRLYKLRPLIDHLFEAFQTVYTPGPSVAVDESSVMWKGCLHFRQYLPLKRARFGIKLFCLAEDSGYLYRFRIYAGKQDPATAMLSVMPSECANFSHTEQVVVYMALPLLDKGYSTFMDNWYSNCRLYDYLHNRQITACGTMRSNRVPLPVRQSQPAVGQSTAFRCGPLLCLKFKDKKDIYMLTTCHDETMVKPPRSRGRPRTDKETELKPQCIVDYNKNMGSVDRVDAVLHPYSAARKSMKWYKKLAFHLLQVALLNAHILYSKSGGDKTFLQFSHDVIADLILSGDVAPTDKVESVVRLTQRHFPEKLQPSATWTKPQARCRVCYKKGQRRDVTTICPKCPSKPGLCTVPCFELWHTKLWYWE